MKPDTLSFSCSPELRARLRELRLRAGLSLGDLSHIMGRSPGHKQRLSRLESGKLKHPTLGLVADYLRACRASFNDILMPLAQYTNLPPLRERQRWEG